MNLWNVFDAEMVLRGVCFAAGAAHAIAIVAEWHGTGNTEGWSAGVGTSPWVREVNPRAV